MRAMYFRSGIACPANHSSTRLADAPSCAARVSIPPDNVMARASCSRCLVIVLTACYEVAQLRERETASRQRAILSLLSASPIRG